ncbi:MAG: DUF4388 domain-containing protein [Ktedonobacterales bacterium]
MPLSGTFRQFSLPDVLGKIESGQRSGLLLVTDGTRQAAMYFDGGQWLLGDRIGSPLSIVHRLARAGYVSEAQVEAALGMPFEQAAQLAEVQVVRALVQAGVLGNDQVQMFVQDDALGLLAVMLGWSEGEFAFEEAIAPPRGRLCVPMPTSALVAQALGAARPSAPRLSAPRHSSVQLSPATVLAFTEPEPNASGEVALTREQWMLLACVDGHSPLFAVSEQLRQPEQLVLHVATELVGAGILEIAPWVGPGAH